MPTTAKVICDSISESGVRLTTMVLEYPRIIHSEVMTHRMFSRNASSSRAIPIEKQIERVENNPFIPKEWGSNKRGMQAGEQILDYQIKDAVKTWTYAKDVMVTAVGSLMYSNVHKQLANRLLEPFSHIQVVVTATEWDNFFLQRLDKNAQPEIQELARVMKEAMDNSIPFKMPLTAWHCPFIEAKDWDEVEFYIRREGQETWDDMSEVALQHIIKISVARCARVSYGLNERGWGDIEKDLALYDMLLTNNHWSPFEHQATPMKYWLSPYAVGHALGVTHVDNDQFLWSGNFKGWIQNRQLIQQSNG